MSEPDHAPRVFRVALLASFGLLAYMFLPFVAILLTAAVLVVVTWPLFARLGKRIGRGPAAVVTTLALVVVILGPTAALVWLGVREAAQAAQELGAFVAAGGLDQARNDLEAAVPALRPVLSELPAVDEVLRPILEYVAGALAGWLTSLVQAVAQSAIHLMVGIASMIALFTDGPKLAANLKRAGLLRESYLDHLFVVFRQFAQNVIVGMFATAASQGLVSALGFWLAGAPRVALLGILTAVLSQFPVVGSLVVWPPVALQLLASGRYIAAGFVVVWSLALTGTVDNLIKPFVYQTGLNVHPLLLLIVLLAGLISFGPTGLLLGPLALVLFLTLWTLYDRDVLGGPGPLGSQSERIDG